MPSPNGLKHEKKPVRPAGRKPLLALVSAVIVIASAVAVWQILIRDGEDDPVMMDPSAIVIAEPADADQLRDLAKETPVYWAGILPGAEIELSRPAPDRVFVRYLTAGAEPGDPRPIFLTVATYQVEEAAKSLEEQADAGLGTIQHLPGAESSTLYWSEEHPESAWLAFEGEDVQIEVFAPEPRRAMQLARSGMITPVP